MKRFFLVIATVLVAGVAVSSATADGPFYQASEFQCQIAIPDGAGGYTYVLTSNSSFVISASGRAELRCEGLVHPGSRVHMNPNTDPAILCGYFDSDAGVFASLPYWSTDIRRGGVVQLHCKGQLDLNNGSPNDNRMSAGGVTGTG